MKIVEWTEYVPKIKFYLNVPPNQPIVTYQGLAELIQNEQVIQGAVVVFFAWFPKPYVSFNFTYFGTDRVTDNDENVTLLTLKLIELGVSVKARRSLTTYYGTGYTQVKGSFCEPIVQGCDKELASLIFYLPNFGWFDYSNTWGFVEDEKNEEVYLGWLSFIFSAQQILTFEDWRIVVATCQEGYDIEEQLNFQGGFALNHCCKLERKDQTPFNVDDVRDLLEALSYYFSFVRGVWTTPMILTGLDAEGNLVWEEWSACRADSWQKVDSWCYFEGLDFVEAFPGFMRRWQNENWRNVIKDSISWYIDVKKCSGGINGAIAIQQIALEYLAWYCLVEDKKSLSSGGFEKLPAADKLRLLLSLWNVDTTIPSCYSQLLKLAKEYDWDSGIDALAEIRNSIVHYSPKQRKKRGSEEARAEVWEIGLNYLEQVLLKIFDFPNVQVNKAFE